MNQRMLYDDQLGSDSCGIGFIANRNGQTDPRVLPLAMESLKNVAHRGGVSADGMTSDGSGILCDLPKGLVAHWLKQAGLSNSDKSTAVAMVFFPRAADRSQQALEKITSLLNQEGIGVLGSRIVPTDEQVVGSIASKTLPNIQHLFIPQPDNLTDDEFERSLYRVNRKLEKWRRESGFEDFNVVSMSKRVIVYKALVLADCLAKFYPDLNDPKFELRFCIYHQRFSTNTTTKWGLCQPFQAVAHNGEINTIRGNRNWMNARQPSLTHECWGDSIEELFPITWHDESDSASLNNALQLLRLSGRSLTQAMSILVPPAWQNSTELSREEKEFYDFQSCFSEPWDGPAAIAFTDGNTVAACLDRNGLRPARYHITSDNLLIVSSETGADRYPEATRIESGRLAPGQMIALDLDKGEITKDRQIKQTLAAQNPYGEWLRAKRIHFTSTGVPQSDADFEISDSELVRRQIAAGLTVEDRDIVIGSMVESGKETTFSMGLDTPLAVLSRRPQLISRYFKQRFAQVTNPPIDSIREKIVMSVAAGIGPERNLLSESPDHCKIISVEHPVLFEHERDQIKGFVEFPSVVIDTTYELAETNSLKGAISELCELAVDAVESGQQILILSDQMVSRNRIAIPMLLAIGAVHHRLCQSGLRMRASLIADTASVWGPHQYALLFGFGATAICPYLALRTATSLQKHSAIVSQRNYRDAIENGLRKIMAKMGISVLNSYQGAQIFEAVGLGSEITDRCFHGTISRIEGIGFDTLQRDYEQMHRLAFDGADEIHLDHEGRYKPKKDGVRHLINGRVTKALHQYVKRETDSFEAFSKQTQPDDPYSIRDLLDFSSNTSASVSELESIEQIRERFTTAAMSLGAISPEAHEAIAIAMNAVGGKSNSGEGGEDSSRNIPDSEGNDARSKIKQIASGRFGVTTEYLMSADEIEIKMAQGAKPGEGGQLPGFKVNGLIARLRHTEPGVTLISPPPHHDIYSIEDLAQLIYDLKCVNPNALVCVKLVAKSGVGNIAVGVAKANADIILISGHEGGTGASPLSSINHAGIPWELGLAETHQALVENQLRDRVILRADGGLKNGRDVLIAAILGADEFNFGTMALMSLGCVYVKKCHLNNCPVGIATQDSKFRKRFKGQPEHLIRYINGVAAEVQNLLSGLGKSSLEQVVGQTELLKQKVFDNHDKANEVSLAMLLAKTEWTSSRENLPSKECPKPVECFDDGLMPEIESALGTSDEINVSRNVFNTDRNIGSRISGRIVNENFSQSRLLTMDLKGSAGQSFGAFLVDGVELCLQGDANDYVAKSMSGGTIAIRPLSQLESNADQQVIVGNTCAYGATGGELYVAGKSSERFAIRNSGLHAVVEGCGEHACEYMTRGTVVVLGEVGANLGAGMTGGLAFVFDPESELERRINRESVTTAAPDSGDFQLIHQLLKRHIAKTGSQLGQTILSRWDAVKVAFKKVKPVSESAAIAPHLNLSGQVSKGLSSAAQK